MKKDKMRCNSKNISLAVWSPTSDGASVVTACLVEYLSRAYSGIVTAIDADTYCPNLDNYLKINFTPDGVDEGLGQGCLNLISDALIKDQLTLEVYNELTVKYKKNCNIITGNNSLRDWEEIWNGDKNSNYYTGSGKDCFWYYEEIFKKARETSDIVIADTSSNISSDSTKFFIHKSDYVIVVVSANFVQLSKAKKFIRHCEENYSLSKDKTLVLVNKHNKCSLSNHEIRHILKGWKVLNNMINGEFTVFEEAANKRNVKFILKGCEQAFGEIYNLFDFSLEGSVIIDALDI
jgi:MinD-like ATPase involved in chromosome partitioning or flagellar assembly